MDQLAERWVTEVPINYEEIRFSKIFQVCLLIQRRIINKNTKINPTEIKISKWYMLTHEISSKKPWAMVVLYLLNNGGTDADSNHNDG